MLRSRFVTTAAIAALLALWAPVPASAQSGLQTEQRLDDLSDQMRQLTGRIEELTNQVNQLKAQLERQASDDDVRFKQLEGGGGGGTASLAPSGAPGAATAARPPQPKPPPGAGADFSQPPSRSGNIGTLVTPGAQRQAPPQTATAGGTLPAGNAQDQYNYAFGLVKQANYPAAVEAMRAFVQQHPNDPLAGNAQYWLGATYYVMKDYNQAATAFAQGYEKYPHGSKAPEELLSLGMSLTALNQKADACKAYARLEHDFPTLSQSIKDKLGTEKQRAGCRR